MDVLKLNVHAVNQELRVLLERLMQESCLSAFVLVDGTALALLLGHRKSEDIDLFTTEGFNSQHLADKINTTHTVQRIYHEENTIRAFINDIKIELIAHQYEMIEDMINVDGIRIASLKDLAAMKLNAIAGRGLKKDFWDIGSLLERYTLSEMIGYYLQKYPNADQWHLLRSLSYFENAETDKTPIINLTDITWEQVKKHIKAEMKKIC